MKFDPIKLYCIFISWGILFFNEKPVTMGTDKIILTLVPNKGVSINSANYFYKFKEKNINIVGKHFLLEGDLNSKNLIFKDKNQIQGILTPYLPVNHFTQGYKSQLIYTEMYATLILNRSTLKNYINDLMVNSNIKKVGCITRGNINALISEPNLILTSKPILNQHINPTNLTDLSLFMAYYLSRKSKSLIMFQETSRHNFQKSKYDNNENLTNAENLYYFVKTGHIPSKMYDEIIETNKLFIAQTGQHNIDCFINGFNISSLNTNTFEFVNTPNSRTEFRNYVVKHNLFNSLKAGCGVFVNSDIETVFIVN